MILYWDNYGIPWELPNGNTIESTKVIFGGNYKIKVDA